MLIFIVFVGLVVQINNLRVDQTDWNERTFVYVVPIFPATHGGSPVPVESLISTFEMHSGQVQGLVEIRQWKLVRRVVPTKDVGVLSVYAKALSSTRVDGSAIDSIRINDLTDKYEWNVELAYVDDHWVKFLENNWLIGLFKRSWLTNRFGIVIAVLAFYLFCLL